MSKALRVWDEELVGKTKHTRTIYTNKFNLFLERWKLTPDELFELRRTSLESDDPRDKREVERMVRIMMAECKEAGFSASTCRQYSKALNSFFEAQGLPLNLKAKDHPKGYSNGQRLAQREHIRTMWDYAATEFKNRNRAMLMFLKDSGFRIGDANALNISDWLEAETRVADGENFKVFEPKETGKTKAPAFVIVGPESVEAIDRYMEERRENGLPMTPDSPLFLNRQNTRFHPDGFGHVFQRLGKFLDKKRISAHSLRKFHTTMLESAGIPQNWIKKLQGRVVGGSLGPYSLPEETGELYEAYVRAYPKLRIFEEQVSTQKLNEQEKVIQSLQSEVEQLRSEKREAEDITTRLEKLVRDLLARVERIEDTK
jgi:integrase